MYTVKAIYHHETEVLLSTRIMIRLDMVACWFTVLQAEDGRDGRGVQLPERLPAERFIHVVMFLHWLELYLRQAEV